MKRLPEIAAALAFAAAVTALPVPAAADWSHCWHEDHCQAHHLNVVLAQGNATVTVTRSCTSSRRHLWRRHDASGRITQWLDAAAATGRGAICIPLHPLVDEVVVTPTGGHCGHQVDGVTSHANEPGPGAVLRQGGRWSATVTGCHARIGLEATGVTSFGGIALEFADGFGFGDAYAEDYFYGVYDGFGQQGIQPFPASVYAISAHNTYHYRIQILRNGSDLWWWGWNDGGP